MATTLGRLHAGREKIAATREVKLGLLGGFELTTGCKPDFLPVGSQRVVAFLAIHARPLQRPYVAGKLWPDATEEHASASLRSALWRLRRPGSSLVDATATHLRIQPWVVVDFIDAGARAHRLLSEASGIEDDDYEVLAPAHELLPDLYEEWILLERERFRQLRLHALEALCDRLVAAGRFGAAVRAALAAVGGEPLRESAQRALIRAHLADGNAVEAIRQYRSFRRLLDEELGLEPSEAIRSLFPASLLSHVAVTPDS